MDVTFTLGQMLALGATLVAIVGLVGPGMFKLGMLTQKVDGHDKQINKLFTKIEELLDELRREK